jgi:hypothetical protein
MATISGKGLNIFVGAVNSNFSDSRNWSQQRVPSGSDTAIINSNCTFNDDRVLGALIVNPSATASIGSGRTLTVLGTVNIQGQLAASSSPTINFRGVNNKINSFSPGNSSVYYNGPTNQTIAGCTYYNLYSQTATTKSLSGPLEVRNILQIDSGYVDLGYSDSIIYNARIPFAGTLAKSRSGNVVFSGSLDFTSGTTPNALDFSLGNPTVTCKGGILVGNGTPNVKTGRGTWTFDGNQSIYNNNGPGSNMALTFTCPLIISGSSVVTIDSTGGSWFRVITTQPFNGTSPSSSLVVSSSLQFNTLAAASPMTTGRFIHNIPTNNIYSTLIYSFPDPYINPITASNGFDNYYTMYLSGSTVTLNKNLINTGFFDASGSNLIVSGGYSPNDGLSPGAVTTSFRKSVPGYVFFSGSVTPQNTLFDVTDSTLELQSGFNISQNTNIQAGTGSWIFSKNSQEIRFAANGTLFYTIPNIVVSGSIAVTHSWTSGAPGTLTTFSLTGTTGSAIFRNNGTMYYSGSTEPMLTGSLDVSSSLNTFIYTRSGSQNIKGGTYRNLTLAGSGSKTLMGNVSVLNTLVTGSLITLITGSFTLTNP